MEQPVSERPVLGIDLGTTYSCVAHLADTGAHRRMSEPLPRAVVRSRRVVIALLVFSMLTAAGAMVALVAVVLPLIR